jgi:hypothetical protein
LSGILRQSGAHFISTHGYWAVALVVGLESIGLPLPGETALVLATIYAATDPNVNVWLVITAAAVGSIIGDNVGYWLGKKYGYALLLRDGRHIGMSDANRGIVVTHLQLCRARRKEKMSRICYRARARATATLTPNIERLTTTDASQAISRSSIHMTGLQCRNQPLLLSPHQGQATRS